MFSNRRIRILWSNVSKADDKSSRISMVGVFFGNSSILFEVWSSEVSVLLSVVYALCNLCSMLLLLMYVLSCLAIILSIVLDMKERLDMGR